MRPNEGRMSLWPVAVIVIVGILVVLSITPTIKLTTLPPSDFVGLHSPSIGPHSTIADGYWQVAVNVTQWKYSRTSPLPEQMPADFRLPDDTGRPGNIPDRGAYWKKLREDWLKPENWHTSYSIDVTWPLRSALSFSREVLRFINQT